MPVVFVQAIRRMFSIRFHLYGIYLLYVWAFLPFLPGNIGKRIFYIVHVISRSAFAEIQITETLEPAYCPGSMPPRTECQI